MKKKRRRKKRSKRQSYVGPLFLELLAIAVMLILFVAIRQPMEAQPQIIQETMSSIAVID